MTSRRSLIAAAAFAGLLGTTIASAQVLGPPRPGQEAPGAAATTSNASLETLRRLGLTPVTPITRDDDHLEVEATTADGRRVSVSFHLDGRLWEIEDENHDKDHVSEWRDMDQDTVRRLVTEAGFGFGRVLEEKPRHVVVRATTRDGAGVILHMDRNGYIYKQIWPRS